MLWLDTEISFIQISKYAGTILEQINLSHHTKNGRWAICWMVDSMILWIKKKSIKNTLWIIKHRVRVEFRKRPSWFFGLILLLINHYFMIYLMYITTAVTTTNSFGIITLYFGIKKKNNSKNFELNLAGLIYNNIISSSDY